MVDHRLSEVQIKQSMEHTSIAIHSSLEEFLRTYSHIITDSLIQYRFVDTTYVIKTLGENSVDSSQIIKDLIVGYMKVRYSDSVVENGPVNFSKIYLAEKPGISYEAQCHYNPNKVKIYPHYLITYNKRDSSRLSRRIKEFMDENIEFLKNCNQDAGGRRQFLFLKTDDLGTRTIYLPFIAPTFKRVVDGNSANPQSFITTVRYIFIPIHLFYDITNKFNINATILNTHNNE